MDSFKLIFKSLNEFVSNKDVFSYNYINSFDRYEETKFPDKDKFTCTIIKENIVTMNMRGLIVFKIL